MKGSDGKNVIPGGQLTIKDGDIFSAESLAYQKKSAKDALDAGKISEEVYERVTGRLKKVPDFVLGEIIFSFQVDSDRDDRADDEEERPKKPVAKASKAEDTEDDTEEEEAPRKPLKKSAKSRDVEENW